MSALLQTCSTLTHKKSVHIFMTVVAILVDELWVQFPPFFQKLNQPTDTPVHISGAIAQFIFYKQKVEILRAVCGSLKKNRRLGRRN